MNRGVVLGVLVAVGAASAVSAAYQAQQQNQPKVVEVEKLKDNLYMLTGGGGNTAVFVGTTVLTGFNMNQVYALSVTGTVTSTGTKAIPAGCVPGEQIHVLTPTAASTPSGTINIAGTTVATGAAATALSGINATSVQAQFAWDPTNSWQNLSVTTATYS